MRGKLPILTVVAGLVIAGPASVLAGAPPALAAHVRVGHGVTIRPAVSNTALAGFADFDPSGPSHFPFYDSASNSVSVTPTGTTGEYQVLFYQLGFTGGDVQLTSAFGACVIQSWARVGKNLAVNVNCFDGTGSNADEPFDLTVTKPVHAPSGVLDYALVPPVGTSLAAAYDYNSSRKANKVRHLATGEYLVTMPGPGPKGSRGVAGASAGTVKVSAYGNVPGACQLARWQGTSTGQELYVDCFAMTGARQNMGFTIAYARATNIMGQNGLVDANALADQGGDLYQPAVQYDSARGARVTVARLQAGLYLYEPAGSDLVPSLFNGGYGDLQITAIGSHYAACGFLIDRTHLPLIEVQCLNTKGNQVSSAFTAQWTVR